jgi:hypothetical protein
MIQKPEARGQIPEGKGQKSAAKVHDFKIGAESFPLWFPAFGFRLLVAGFISQ